VHPLERRRNVEDSLIPGSCIFFARKVSQEEISQEAGLFGIEIEATTKVSVRSIWLKKLN
jgi:hypothetical protein